MQNSNFFFFFFLFLFLSNIVVASSNRSLYDFGTMKEGNFFAAEPGENVTINIYFFVDEVYGNRITHVKVNMDTIPEGWSYEFNPPLHQEYLNVSGILTVSNENLYVEPKPVLPEVPVPPEEGVYYLFSPSGKGYLQAKRVQVNIHVPESAVLGQTYEVKVSAEGFWFGQSGNVALTQSRSFSYLIQAVNREYTESIITSDVLGTGNASSGENNDSEINNGGNEQAQADLNIYVIGGLLLIILALVGYVIFGQKKK